MKLAIVTVNLNNADGLISTLGSVEKLKQVLSVPVEQLVVDGGSTDSSLSVIRRFAVPSMVGKDTGPFDAMNKGLNAVASDYVWFLNSGDHVSDFPKGNIFNRNSVLIYGSVLRKGKKFTSVIKFEKNSIIQKLFSFFPPHPATIYSRSHLLEIGGIPGRFKYLADYQVFLKLSEKYSDSFTFLDNFLVTMQPDGLSDNGLKSYLGVTYEFFKIHFFKLQSLFFVFRFFPKLFYRYIKK
jgi:glycosyltransferase involved in cell wall biosynthesis